MHGAANLRRYTGALLLVLMTLFTCPKSMAQPPEESDRDEWHFRYELFQMLLEQNGLEPATSVKELLNDPQNSVLVMVGRLNGTIPPSLVESFCELGGAVLLASDLRYAAGRICEFRQSPATSIQRRDWYQSHSDCLEITDLNQEHPLMTGVNSIVLNRSGWLDSSRWSPRKQQAAARLPRECDPAEARNKPVIATLTLNRRGSGPVIMAGDQSLFTNGMLWHGDNAILAINISRTLCEGPRSQLLFVADGVILGSYKDSPLLKNRPWPASLPELPENMPEPELQTMLRVANSVIRNVEQSNLMNEVLANRPRNARAPYYWRICLFVLAIVALAFVIWRISATGLSPQQPMPSRAMKTAQELSSGRKIKSTEFGFASSMLARELCRELTGQDDSADWQSMLSANAATGAMVTQEMSLQNQLSVVLDLAVNTRTVHISRRRFESIGQIIDHLRKLNRQGKLLRQSGSATDTNNLAEQEM
ncbi:MAG: hypothetical protein GY758_34095 [Fuerstiella sp.]|nr:hypothetical protein [Fuerstiella sp.]MCP4508815.1 hypothetical protein [Fuerstiella sp.]